MYWANLALAYASLPASAKRKLKGKGGGFSYAKRVSGYDQETTPEEVQRKTPDVTHALVNEHPNNWPKSVVYRPSNNHRRGRHAAR